MSEAETTRTGPPYQPCSFYNQPLSQAVLCSTHKQGAKQCAQFFFRQLQFALHAEHALMEKVESFQKALKLYVLEMNGAGCGNPVDWVHVASEVVRTRRLIILDNRKKVDALEKDLEDAKNKAADAWVTGHQNRQLRWALRLAKLSIEQAINSEDGLDGADGEDLLKVIDRTANMRKIENEMSIIAMQEKIEAADKMLKMAEEVIRAGEVIEASGFSGELHDLDVAANEYGKVKVPLP